MATTTGSEMGDPSDADNSAAKAVFSEKTGETLCSRSFIGLLTTQFLGAVNDNMFRWLVVPIGKELVGSEQAALALSVGLACFVLPYILLAAPAGYLADRFSKRTIIVSCKVAELLIMMLGIAAVLWGDLYVMFAVVALMGSQSALFAPSKLGSIPEIVSEDRISAANGLIGMTTVLAIVVGTIAGNCLYSVTRPPDGHLWWISAVALIGTAALGLIASLMIRPLRSANPARPFPYNPARQTFRDLAALGSSRPLLRAALGTAAFWALAALAQMNVDLFAITELGVNQMHVGILLAVALAFASWAALSSALRLASVSALSFASILVWGSDLMRRGILSVTCSFRSAGPASFFGGATVGDGLEFRFRSARNLYVLRYLYLESRESALSRAAFCWSVSSFSGAGLSLRT